MTQTQHCLFELGCEELPPKQIKKLSQSLKTDVLKLLDKAGLTYGDVQVFGAPRRLGLLIKDLLAEQPAREVERRGPAVEAAYNDKGEPTPAALGFARSCGVELDALDVEETPKGKWLHFCQHQAGETIQACLPGILQTALQQQPIRKPMRWSDKAVAFIRPVHWCVLLYGNDVIDATILGKQSGRTTFGHRFHHPDSIELKTATDYEDALQQAYVVASFEQRQQIIREQITQIASDLNAKLEMDNDLLDEVTGLVEWPVALKANFSEDFLKVPAECLIAAMRDHQKSFHLRDGAGKLLPHFITVANLESKQAEQVVTGNEKVMAARLSDAKFFYETDLKTALASRLEALAHVTFQTKLGNLKDKAERLSHLSGDIAKMLKLDSGAAAQAGLLAKCDLVSDMVGEFPELQGIMGYHYARASQESDDVATAIKEHYQPAFAGDAVPTSSAGICVALADKLDVLLGIFAIGKKPTGVKDPFSLRRAALGVVRIISENRCALNLDDLLQAAAQHWSATIDAEPVMAEVKQFIIERLRAWYLDKGVAPDVIQSVLERQDSDFNDFAMRVDAVLAFQQLKEAQNLAQANKRVSKILLKEKVALTANGLDQSLLKDNAEIALAEMVAKKEQAVTPMFAEHDYKQALCELASLQQPIDLFFDEVMVMTDDEQLKQNRLKLLTHIRQLFLKVADISLLQNA
jgi:glycyl-tRNA synthetase beta chain